MFKIWLIRIVEIDIAANYNQLFFMNQYLPIMKTRTLLLLCLLLGFSVAQVTAQTVKKGAVVCVNTYTYTLNPDVTFNQFLDFYLKKYIPEFEKCFPGVKTYVLWGDRGDKKNQMGTMDVYESVAVRDKYYPTENDTTSSEAYKVASEKMEAMNNEMNKFFIGGGVRTYTDWIVK